MKQPERDLPAKVLIVDDEPQITRVLRTALSTQGYSLRVASNGVEGMEAVHDWRPDLVITDLAMPQMDGFETAMRIRRRRWGREIVLCALSAFDTPEFRERSDEVGINRYLAKPAEWDELLAVAAAT